MKTLSAPVPALLLCAVAACGGGASDVQDVTVAGTVNGARFEARDASTTITTIRAGSSGATLRVSTVVDACALSGHAKGELVLSALLVTLNGGVAQLPTEPGSFGVVDGASNSFPSSGNAAFVVFESADQQCSKTEVQGASGRITLTKADFSSSGEVTGDLDVILQNGSRIRGAFRSGICPPPASGGTAPACQ